ELERAKAEQRAARRESARGIGELYFALAEAEARRSVMANEVLPAARATFDAFRLAFERHAENLNELLDSRHDRTRAEIDHIDSLVDVHRSLAALEAMVGQPLAGEP
ncbi:MAG TPA: TolC family protein, partial [Candidatus Polarisedimenticolaceae bacterium]|nr:TolC family protein [Candidatus Polarisedimenticolaceae bacterium]